MGNHVASFNEGVNFSEGKYVICMGDDDYFEKNALDKIIKYLKENPQTDWLIARSSYVNNSGEPIRKNITKIKNLLLKNFNEKSLSVVNYVMTPSVVVKKHLMLSVGGFESKYKYANDYYCWLKISKFKKPNILNYTTTRVTFSNLTFSGSFSFLRYFEFFKIITKIEKRIYLNFIQLLSVLYIVFHNFTVKRAFFLFNFYKKKEEVKIQQNNKDDHKKIKILHLTRYFDPKKIGGIEEGIIQSSKYQKKFGIYNEIMACGDLENSFIFDGIKINVSKQSFIISNNVFSYAFLKMLIKKKNEFDYINLHFPWPFADFCVFLFCKNKKIILNYHSDIIKQKFLKYFYIKFFKIFINSKIINCINVSSEKYFESSDLKKIIKKNKYLINFQKMGYEDLSNIHIPLESIRNEIKVFFNQNKKIILFFGRNRHYKGLDVIEYIISNNKNKNFLISCNNLMLHKKYKSNRNILLLDGLNYFEKLYVLKKSYLNLFPSLNRAESLGLTLIECQMFGLPSLVFEINSGTSLIIKDNETGIIVKNIDFDEYNKKLNNLYFDETLRNSLSEKSRSNYLDNFSVKKFDNYAKNLLAKH